MNGTVGMLDRIAAQRAMERRSFPMDSYISNYLIPLAEQVGRSGIIQTWPADGRTKEISDTLPGYFDAIRQCPPAYAAQLVRSEVLSQARFIFRNNRISPTTGRLFGTSALRILEQPWPRGTTGELIARMEWHEALAGNAFVVRQADRLRVLRPDWVLVVYGSEQEPEDAAHALDGTLLGYAYCNGGFGQARNPVRFLLPDEVAHWAPQPDPTCAGVGMSWITPAIREIQGDIAASTHKVMFFANGATPNMVVTGLTAATREQFDDIVDAIEDRHAGLANAYRTMYLAAGADATVVGADLKQIDFKATQGAGETRISMLSRVHPVILGASEGLAGSSLNAGNFGSARRMWADTFIYPMLQSLAACLGTIVVPPGDAELWTDTRDMPILREDARDAAEIEDLKARTITNYVKEGFTWESAVQAVARQDVTLLVHTGLISVQLQPPGAPAPVPAPTPPK